MLLSNRFNNKLDNCIDNFIKKNIINYCYNRNATSFCLLTIGENSITSLTEIEKGALERNRIISHFEIEKKIKSANRNIFDINILY